MATILNDFIEKLSKSLKDRAQQLRGAAPSTDLFADLKSRSEVLDLFSRDEYFKKLRALDQDTHSMKDWVAAKMPVEFLAGLERDTRARYRSRLDHYRAASVTKGLPPIFMDRLRSVVEILEAK